MERLTTPYSPPKPEKEAAAGGDDEDADDDADAGGDEDDEWAWAPQASWNAELDLLMRKERRKKCGQRW